MNNALIRLCLLATAGATLLIPAAAVAQSAQAWSVPNRVHRSLLRRTTGRS